MFRQNLKLLLLLFTSLPSLGLAANCTIKVLKPVNFASYDPLINEDNKTKGTVSLDCSNAPITYTVNLSAGQAGSFFPRKMSNGQTTLNYNLYKEDGQVWGDGQAGTANYIESKRCGSPSPDCLYTVYGVIPHGQSDVTVGNYTDSITVTVIY